MSAPHFTLLIKTRSHDNPFDMNIDSVRMLCEAKVEAIVVLESKPLAESGLTRVEVEVAPWRINRLYEWFGETDGLLTGQPAPCGALLLFREVTTPDVQASALKSYRERTGKKS